MFKISIPGNEELQLTHIVLDYNGTLAKDGLLIEGVRERLIALNEDFIVHVVTGDSFGTVQNQLRDIPCKLTIIGKEQQGLAKEKYIQQIDPNKTVMIGNGRNDREAMRLAKLGVVVNGEEGCVVATLQEADIMVPNILAALDLFLEPIRLMATLRN